MLFSTILKKTLLLLILLWSLNELLLLIGSLLATLIADHPHVLLFIADYLLVY